jgi:hypothetical protein
VPEDGVEINDLNSVAANPLTASKGRKTSISIKRSSEILAEYVAASIKAPLIDWPGDSKDFANTWSFLARKTLHLESLGQPPAGTGELCFW